MIGAVAVGLRRPLDVHAKGGRMLLEGKSAVIDGGGGAIGGAA